MSSTTYRALIWGPGNLGKIAIREAQRTPWLELVGARAYSADKDGVDLGTLAGIAPIGVRATSDPDVALGIDCDVVLHLARDYGRHGAVDEIVALLEAGKDVITVHPFQHLDHAGETGVSVADAQRISAAAESGGATFHSTGIHPGFMAERIATTLTGLCTDVSRVCIHENWDHAHFDAKTLTVLGFGSAPEVLQARPAVARMTDNYLYENLYGLADALEAEIVRVEVGYDYAAAPVDLHFETIDVPAGTVGRITRTMDGYRAGDAEPFLTMQANWLLGRSEMVPEGFEPGDYYVIRIEGTPSVEVATRFKASLERDEYLVVPGDRGSDPGYYGVVAAVLHAIPRVVDATPGVLGSIEPGTHWTMRSAATPLPAR